MEYFNVARGKQRVALGYAPNAIRALKGNLNVQKWC
jgi:hypothetical protein